MQLDNLEDLEKFVMDLPDGLYLGLLQPDEYRRFHEAEELGLVARSYDGIAGFLGIGKVKKL